jgi:hypothetical protein
MTWHDILNTYNNEALGAMCTALRLSLFAGNVRPNTRQQAIHALQKVMGKPDTVATALNAMGAAETALLRAVLRQGGIAPTEAAYNAMVADGVSMREKRLPRYGVAAAQYEGVPYFEEIVARTTAHALLFSRNTSGVYSARQTGLAPEDTLFIPESVLQQLEVHSDLARPIEVKAGAPKQMRVTSAFDFQRDLSRYWRHARKQGEIAFTTQGWMYKANFKTFLAALNLPTDAAQSPTDEASYARLWFMRRLLTALGEFLGTHADSFLSVRAESQLLAMPMRERIKTTYDVWRHSGAWNELLRLPVDHSGPDHRRDASPELGKARDILLRTIAKAAAGHAEAWLSTEALVGQMRRSHYDFLFPRSKKRNYSYYGGPYNSPQNNAYGICFPSIYDEARGWSLVEQPFIINVLTGPLHWLGLVELGYSTAPANTEASENSPATAFRLTPVGAWLLGIGDAPEFVESGGRLVVQPNFTILAMEPISDTVLVDLDRFADVQGGDRAIAYQLSRESLYRGQLQGWDAPTVLAFLESHQGAPVAGNVRRTLEEWEQQHRRITFHRGVTLVHYADAEAEEEARAVLAAAQLQPRALGAAAFGARVDVVGVGKASAAIATLREAGWVPLVQAKDTAATAAVTAAPDKHVLHVEAEESSDTFAVTFAQPTANILVLGQLARFAELNTSGAWRITPSSVRGAIQKNTSVEQVLALLADLSVGPVSAKLERSVRKWGGYFGKASLQSVALLELSSYEVLANLANDEEIGQWITPIEGAGKPLAVIAIDQAENVRRLLIERGVAFS